MFDFWKFIKKYHDNSEDNMEQAVKEADRIMKKYDRNLFNMMIFGFLEQKSFEAIRGQKITDDEIEKMNSVHFPLSK